MRRSLQALGRLPAGTLNRTEAAYSRHLEGLVRSGAVLDYRFEAVKLRLADNTFYSPDFVVQLADRTLECHEVKGFWTDDARVKIKVAAALFPWFRFIAVQARSRKDGGGWAVETFGRDGAEEAG